MGTKRRRRGRCGTTGDVLPREEEDDEPVEDEAEDNDEDNWLRFVMKREIGS